MTRSTEPKTHFEQVPLEVVKDLADKDIPTDEADGPDRPVKPPVKKRSRFRVPTHHR